MKKALLFLYVMLLVMMCAGCTSNLYTWKSYDSNLYSYYKNPVEREKFIENLKMIIQAGEETGKVPPGIYAEYGYMLFESGKFTEAIVYFQKEYDKWPESHILMEKMIRNAKSQEGQKIQ